MSVPRELYLFFLRNSKGHHYYVNNGRVYSGVDWSKWLKEAPDGWIETQISFARNTKYYGINRSFVPPLKFVGDGATIIRSLLYTGKGTESDVILDVYKWDDTTGTYEPYYRGGLDLAKAEDDVATGITVNLLETGIMQLLKANENNTYEIPCDGSIPENVRIEIDGIQFHDVFHYSTVNVDLQGGSFVVPLVFQTNDGDNIGILKGDQEFETFSDPFGYAKDSNNYFFGTIDPVHVSSFSGTISFQNKNSGSAIYKVYLKTNLLNESPLYIFNGTVQKDETKTIDLSTVGLSVSLEDNGKLFLLCDVITSGSQVNPNANTHWIETTVNLTFDSKYKPTQCFGIRCNDFFRLLANKAGITVVSSSLLEANKDIVITSGMCLRNPSGIALTDQAGVTTPTVIKSSLSDFFTSFNAILNASMGIEKIDTYPFERLYFEKKIYAYDSSIITLDIGEVSDLKISISDDLFNNLTIGYTDQKYDEKQGSQEYNTTLKFSAPILAVQKSFDQISKYRADSYGIEYTRYLAPGNQTANNASDNDVFLINTDGSSTTYQPPQIDFKASDRSITLIGEAILMPFNINDFIAGTVFTVSGSVVNDRAFTIVSTSVTGVGSQIHLTLIVKELVADGSSVTATVTLNYLKLKRVAYDNITGIVNPDTAYNIEALTPKRMFLNWGNYFRGVLGLQVTDYIKFLSSDKNKNLATKKGNSLIIESADVLISSLPSPLFYPLTASFTTKVPLTFEQVMAGAANGHIRVRYNGKMIYGFPGEVTVKPTLNDSQEWKIQISPLTSLADLVDLEINGLNTLADMGYNLFTPDLNPVQFVPLGQILPPQYHFRHMNEWWYSEQIQMYSEQRQYAAKWQNNDIIKLQVQTNGLAPVQVQLLNDRGKVLATIELVTKNDPAVKLPMVLFEGNVPLIGYDEGFYYLLISAGTGDTIAQAISEPLYLKEDHEDTLLLEYDNSKNKQAFVFSTGNGPWSMRVEGWLDSYKPEASFTTYTNQSADLELLNGIPNDSHKLHIGYNDGIPDWVARKMNKIMLLNSVMIDGKYFTRNADAKWESQTNDGSALKFWTLDIREAKNRDGISTSTDGTLDDSFTVIYNINTRAFGDGAGSNNIIQVEQVDND